MYTSTSLLDALTGPMKMIDIEKNTETQKDLKFRLSLKYYAQLTNNNDN